MDIKSAKYITSSITNQNGSILVTFNDDTYASVPLVVGNRHYDAILEWAKIDGNTIEAAD
jgi:hypothetical protein|tara:strand:- start:13 stop:192 length:180 start_codon:yes stop_codon:yes gene_type:complete